MDKRIVGAVIGAVVVIIVVGVVAVYFVMQYAPAAAYKVSGYVKTDGTALPGVSVTLDGKSATTDANGYYEFTGLEGDKSYTLVVSKSGYESYSANIQVGTQDKVVDEISLKTEEIAMPLAAIRSALATREGVSTSSVELYFCVQAAETDNYAVGAVIDNQKSIVFIYVESTSTIVVENEDDMTTSDEQEAMAKFIVKKPLSRVTGHKMVPFNFVKKGNAYSFNYYDGWEGPYPWTRYWGFGVATMDADGNIPENNMTHTWIP